MSRVAALVARRGAKDILVTVGEARQLRTLAEDREANGEGFDGEFVLRFPRRVSREISSTARPLRAAFDMWDRR